MQVCVIKRASGGISIIHPVNDDIDFEAEVLKWRSIRDDYQSHEIISKNDLPSYDEFRDSWGHDLKIDIIKARDIHMDRIRIERDKRLKALDIETMRGNDVQAEKQLLRDLPQNTDLTTASTPEELRSIWPFI